MHLHSKPPDETWQFSLRALALAVAVVALWLTLLRHFPEWTIALTAGFAVFFGLPALATFLERVLR